MASITAGFTIVWCAAPHVEAGHSGHIGARFNCLDYGYFASGAAMLNIDEKARVRGLLIANGSDWSPQPLSMYYLDDSHGQGSIDSMPDWFSSDAAYNTGVCVGDVNGDGFDDAVVTTISDEFGRTNGGFRIYYGGVVNRCSPGTTADTIRGQNTRPQCSPVLEPPRTLSREPEDPHYGFGANACALADLDGDGDLDLVIAAPWEEAGRKNGVAADALRPRSPAGDGNGPFARFLRRKLSGTRLLSVNRGNINGNAHVFINQPRDGHAHFEEAWSPKEVPGRSRCPGRGDAAGQPLGPGALAVTDLDGDGWLDLVFSGARVVVFFGHPTVPDHVAYSTLPDWISANEFSFSPSVTVGRDPAGKAFIVATKGCSGGSDRECCAALGPSAYFVYRPEPGQTSYIWHADLPKGAIGSAVRVMYGSTRQPELVGAVWLDAKGAYGGPLRHFAFDPGLLFSLTPDLGWLAHYSSIVATLMPITINRCEAEPVALSRQVAAGERRSVFNVPDATLETPVLLVSGEPTATRHRFTVVDGGIAVAPPVVGPATVEINYERRLVTDLVVTSTSPLGHSGYLTVYNSCTPN